MPRPGTPSRRKLLAYFASCKSKGATDEEAAFALGYTHAGGIRNNRLILLYHELIAPSGRTRTTNQGKQATVWIRTKKRLSDIKE